MSAQHAAYAELADAQLQEVAAALAPWDDRISDRLPLIAGRLDTDQGNDQACSELLRLMDASAAITMSAEERAAIQAILNTALTDLARLNEQWQRTRDLDMISTMVSRVEDARAALLRVTQGQTSQRLAEALAARDTPIDQPTTAARSASEPIDLHGLSPRQLNLIAGILAVNTSHLADVWRSWNGRMTADPDMSAKIYDWTSGWGNRQDRSESEAVQHSLTILATADAWDADLINRCAATSTPVLRQRLAHYMTRSWRRLPYLHLPPNRIEDDGPFRSPWVDLAHRLNVIEAAAQAELNLEDPAITDPLLAAAAAMLQVHDRLALAEIALTESPAAWVHDREQGIWKPNEAMAHHLEARDRLADASRQEAYENLTQLEASLPPATMSRFMAAAAPMMWPQIISPLRIAQSRLDAWAESSLVSAERVAIRSAFAELVTQVSAVQQQMATLLAEAARRRHGSPMDGITAELNALDDQQINLIRAWMDSLPPEFAHVQPY